MLRFKDKLLLSPLWLLSLLPLPVLYLFSNFLFFLTYTLVGYRKRVVFENIANSFPQKNNKEVELITRNFYKHLCDVFIESIYLLNMSVKELDKRYKLTNLDVIEKLYDESKNIVIATSHFGNWEWGTIMAYHMRYKGLAIYRPLSNKTFDNLFNHIRSKYGCKLVPMKQTLREILQCQKENIQYAVYTLGDQRPEQSDLGHWRKFLNQETPVITGMGKLAQRFNLTVVLAKSIKTRRGHYEIEFEVIADNSKELSDTQITNAYIDNLEKMIKNQPELWLWTHKRWKFKKEDYFRGQ